MKKKLTAVALVVCMLAIMLVGASLAYFTDESDVATNVMTLGNVTIEQYEKDKEGKNFVQEQKLIPAVDNRKDKETNPNPVVDGWFSEDYENVIDKVVTVKNTGTEAAYVRTIFAFEGRSDVFDVYIGRLRNTKDWDYKFLPRADQQEAGKVGPNGEFLAKEIEVDGVVHTVMIATYKTELAGGAETEPSLKQFFLAPTADNEVLQLFGKEYTIHAVSQAVQVAGFEELGAEYALNEAFGELTDANLYAWLNAAAE